MTFLALQWTLLNCSELMSCCDICLSKYHKHILAGTRNPHWLRRNTDHIFPRTKHFYILMRSNQHLKCIQLWSYKKISVVRETQNTRIHADTIIALKHTDMRLKRRVYTIYLTRQFVTVNVMRQETSTQSFSSY